jgi:hypothetical protein
MNVTFTCMLIIISINRKVHLLNAYSPHLISSIDSSTLSLINEYQVVYCLPGCYSKNNSIKYRTVTLRAFRVSVKLSLSA